MIRERTELEKKVNKWFMKDGYPKPIHRDHLDELNGIPLGDRSELLKIIQLLQERMSCQLNQLKMIQEELLKKPTIKVVEQETIIEGICFKEIPFGTVFSIWYRERREFYYSLGQSTRVSQNHILAVKLNKKLKIDGRFLRGFSAYSHLFSLRDLILARIEQHSVVPEMIGATEQQLKLWKSQGIMMSNF